MKKIIIGILLLFLVSCSINNNELERKQFYFDKQKECNEIISKKSDNDFTKEFSNIEKENFLVKAYIKDIFYSPSLNSCLFTYEYKSINNNSINIFHTIINFLTKDIIYENNNKKNYKILEITGLTDIELNITNQIKEQGGNKEDLLEILQQFRSKNGRTISDSEKENHKNNLINSLINQGISIKKAENTGNNFIKNIKENSLNENYLENYKQIQIDTFIENYYISEEYKAIENNFLNKISKLKQ